MAACHAVRGHLLLYMTERPGAIASRIELLVLLVKCPWRLPTHDISLTDRMSALIEPVFLT